MSSTVLSRYVAIGVGGVLGASVRWAVVGGFGAEHGFRWSIFIVNVVGSFLLGLLLGEEGRTKRYHLALHDFGAIGFCGGLTTMSTFSLDVVHLLNNGDRVTAAVYLLANVCVGLLCLVAGAAIARRVTALEIPLEEQP